MDRTIVIAVSAPIPHGHRIEVVERVDDVGERIVLSLTDLETRIRYRHGFPATSDVETWTGRVLECTIASARAGVTTTLLIDPVGPGSAEADVAARSGCCGIRRHERSAPLGRGDRTHEPEPPRFW